WVVTLAGRRRQSAQGVQGPRSHTIGAVWTMSGTALSLFGFSGGISHQAQHDFALYLAAMLFFVGLAHAISAAILRWGVQGAVAAIWWGGGIAILFVRSPVVMLEIFLTATFFGQIVFGLYVMLLERRRSASARVLRHG
ncbi:MAG TPA: hypothetical protein VGU23_07165, partial [Acidobacteriaceae bacterium]|nr:hypothetical protein [Acidobacteriaceae bacterium]